MCFVIWGVAGVEKTELVKECLGEVRMYQTDKEVPSDNMIWLNASNFRTFDDTVEDALQEIDDRFN